jgi:hypothetical protein
MTVAEVRDGKSFRAMSIATREPRGSWSWLVGSCEGFEGAIDWRRAGLLVLWLSLVATDAPNSCEFSYGSWIRKMFLRRLLYSIFWNTGIYGAALFLSAGTFDWWRAWVVVGMIAGGTVATMLLVFRTRPDLLAERMRGMVQKGQPVSDRVIVLTFMFVYGASIWFIPQDVFRLHLLPKPSMWVSSLGLVLVVVCGARGKASGDAWPQGCGYGRVSYC